MASTTTKSDQPAHPPLTLSALAPSFLMATNGEKSSAMPAATVNLCHPTVSAKFATTASAKKHAMHAPSVLRQLIPIAACMLSFATVLSVLIVYMDTTGELS